jgi:DNA polymerase I-like protein with 3'-5' exonuclease and polymerase domains
MSPLSEGFYMKLRPNYLDFETMPIGLRVHGRMPPEPVSFSLKLASWRAPKFYAWGHRTGGNNCTKADAGHILKDVWSGLTETSPIGCFNSKFDLDVAEEHFGLPLPPWHNIHDPMFLLFLDDPHQRELGLKPASARLLNMPQAERDEVEAWILEHKKQLENDFPEIVKDYDGIKPSTAGAFIAYAPGSVVGPYANGDVVRTAGLFDLKFHEVTVERGMKEAYDRERRLMPILLRNEREGLRVDVSRMEADKVVYEAAQLKTDAWLRKALKAPALDFDKDADVAKALDSSGAVTEWTLTKTGRKSVSKKNMKLSHFGDQKIAAAYAYRQKCATTLETFIRPWLYYGASGQMHTNWNQVRQAGAKDLGGTRTGRPSSREPNFLNMPKRVKESQTGGFIMPRHIAGLPELPRVRSYVLPDDKTHVIGRRDFSQQELRMLAHFEDGALLQSYLEDPSLDVHQFLTDEVQRMLNTDVTRDIMKTLVFGYIYGQGVGSLAEKLEHSVQEVNQFRAAQMRVLPGLESLSKSLKSRARAGQSIRTWGNREYYVEPPAMSKKYNRLQTFEYKLINYLVQGSSADVTKESIIRYDDVKKDGRFMLTVYDENDISVPKKALKSEMLLLRECMMSIEVDVPLLSDGEWGPTLGDLEDLKEPPPNLSRWNL